MSRSIARCWPALLLLSACAQTITAPALPDAQARDSAAPQDASSDPHDAALDASVGDAPGNPDAVVEADASCVPVCGAQRCGLDPICGQSCGSCGMDEACSVQGECITTCSTGSASCGGDGVSYQGCGFDETLGIPNLGPRIACGNGAACADGQCSGGGCLQTQLIVVLDRSASIAANGTWAWVRDELLTAIGGYQNDNAIGLRQFPDTQCTPSMVLTPRTEARVSIEAALRPPTADATSPIADALAGLTGAFNGRDDGRAVLLLTDGDETCRSEDDAVRAASILRRDGVRTYPIAIGTAAHRALLDRIAVAGGTTAARAVTDASGLRTALGEILVDVNACRNAHAQVSLAWYHTCAIRADGRLACWGRSQDGRLIVPAGRYSALATSTDAACAAALDGRVSCWGRNLNGQLTPPSGAFVELSGGDSHFCGRRADGTVACWGNNDDGQATAPAGTFTQVTATAFGACAIEVGGSLRCWGSRGALSGMFRQIDGGSFSMCGIHLDGTLSCNGQDTPPLGTFTHVSTGYANACALRDDASIACWGTDGYSLVSNVPSGRFVDVDIEYQTACAVREDDVVVCWGYNDEGMATPP